MDSLHAPCSFFISHLITIARKNVSLKWVAYIDVGLYPGAISGGGACPPPFIKDGRAPAVRALLTHHTPLKILCLCPLFKILHPPMIFTSLMVEGYRLHQNDFIGCYICIPHIRRAIGPKAGPPPPLNPPFLRVADGGGVWRPRIGIYYIGPKAGPPDPLFL